MQMTPFCDICEKLAKTETRSFIYGGDEYAVLEFFCTDPNCDCRRVLLTIMSRNHMRIEASIAFGFDRDSLMGPGLELDPLNPQGPHADAVMKLIKQQVLSDSSYVDRIRRHYAITKQIVQGRLRPQDAPASACLSGYVEISNSPTKVDPELDEILNAPRQSYLSRAERRAAQLAARKREKKLNKVR